MSTLSTVDESAPPTTPTTPAGDDFGGRSGHIDAAVRFARDFF